MVVHTALSTSIPALVVLPERLPLEVHFVLDARGSSSNTLGGWYSNFKPSWTRTAKHDHYRRLSIFPSSSSYPNEYHLRYTFVSAARCDAAMRIIKHSRDVLDDGPMVKGQTFMHCTQHLSRSNSRRRARPTQTSTT